MKKKLNLKNNNLIRTLDKKNHQLREDIEIIAGVDEVGRGCIAGPVCAGVVIFKPENLTKESLATYIDSKKISEPRRDNIYLEITQNHHWAVGESSVEEIDQINIRQASLLAMKRALINLSKKINLKDYFDLNNLLVLVDGRDLIPCLDSEVGFNKQSSVIKGDSLVKQISAASIVAKVYRDRLMYALSKHYPQYGFQTHKGYGTEVHRHAIERFGILQCHRKTFGGVKEYT